MAKRRKAKSATKSPALDVSKLIPSDQVTTRYFVGEVEYCQLPEALRRLGVAEKIGYPEGFQHFASTSIYTYIRTHRTKFSSYIENSSGFPMFPYSEIAELSSEYLAKFPKNSEMTKAETPEVSELMEKLRGNPELAKALLEIVA